MNPTRISIRNRKLAFTESLEFLKFLEVKYPTPGVRVTFVEPPLFSFSAGTHVCHVKGTCTGTTIDISVFETTVVEQLKMIGHEYRHAVQTNEGGYPDSEAKNMQIGGVALKFHTKAEADAVLFSKSSVREFLEWRSGEPSIHQRSASASEGLLGFSESVNAPAARFW